MTIRQKNQKAINGCLKSYNKFIANPEKELSCWQYYHRTYSGCCFCRVFDVDAYSSVGCRDCILEDAWPVGFGCVTALDDRFHDSLFKDNNLKQILKLAKARKAQFIRLFKKKGYKVSKELEKNP